jgi:hypothetical protein
MKLQHSLCALALCLSLLTPLAVTTATAQPAPAPPAFSLPIVGTVAGGTINAVFNLTRFAVQNNQLVAIGTLVGTITNTATGITSSFAQNLALPVTATGSCEILHLELGPLDLNLLGLMVHLDKIVLDITAQSGPGNLLGNLLCAVANLLNGGGALSQIVQLLNQILGQL